MIGSISNSYFQQNYVIKDPQEKQDLTECDVTKQNVEISKSSSSVSFHELVANAHLVPVDTTIKAAVNVMKLQTSLLDSTSATTKVENFDAGYSSGNLMFLCYTDKYGGSHEGYSVAAWESEGSTRDNPQVYVEAWEDGVCNTYCVEINKINLNQATRIEVAAMLEYNKHSIPPVTFITLMTQTVAPSMDTNPSMNDTINFFNECEKYASYVGLPSISFSGSSGKNMQEQFSETIERMIIADEKMAGIVEILDREAMSPSGNNDNQASSGSARELFKLRGYLSDETQNQQSKAWDDIFEERDKRAARLVFTHITSTKV